jgi:hypothetical protein
MLENFMNFAKNATKITETLREDLCAFLLAPPSQAAERTCCSLKRNTLRINVVE